MKRPPLRRVGHAALLLLGICALQSIGKSAEAAWGAAEHAAELVIPGETAWTAKGFHGGRGGAVRAPRGAIGRPGMRPGMRPGRPPGVAHRPRPGVVRPGRPPGIGHRPGRPPGVGHVHRPVRPGVVRPGHRPIVVAPGWRRPAAYWWRPGGAIAAGAALGFIGAAAAASYAGAPPAAGYCWYYTNPQRTQGFWDVCP